MGSQETHRTICQVGDYKTLPLTIMVGRVTERIPAFGSGKVKSEYRDPAYTPPPLSYSKECLQRATESADYCDTVVRSWSRHFSDLAYYLQFQDDPEGELLKRFHSHTELATAVIGGRLDIDCEPLWETFQWLLEFKFVQEAYRKDSDREANYESHAKKLDDLNDRHPLRKKTPIAIGRALEKFKVHASDWDKLPCPTLQKPRDPALRVSLFYSYSHVDENLRDELQTHLAAMQRQRQIYQWHDRRIGPGDDWRGEIDQHLDEADIILLLISSNFIASDYCYDVEMERALERHKSGKAHVIPLFLRSCDWKGCPFGRLKGLPTDAVPVTSWTDRDAAFTDIAKGIRNAVEKIRKSRGIA